MANGRIRKQVFISTPMNGKTDEEVRKTILEAQEAYLKTTGATRKDVFFVDNLEQGRLALEREKLDADQEYYTDEGFMIAETHYVEPQRMPVWYLGIAMCNLAYSDEVVFYPSNWRRARGCKIEWEVCREYDIPHYTAGVNNELTKVWYS